MSASFFTAGGTLRTQVPSYVRRPADDELLDRVLLGEFCYVLTTRQMGKSSLMVRAARQLTEQGHHPVIIDLTAIGTAEIDAWYLGLLSRIRQSLGLRALDLESWWRERVQVSQPQRFAEFLRDVALPTAPGRLVLFIDEIDSTLSLPFRDDFFAAIRAIYQARSDEPIFERLSVVLLGVATPTDLIQDRARTPFNIGRRIVLQEFRYAEAGVLEAGLEAAHPGAGAIILRRIFYWTSGHPYLTQKLCLAAAESSLASWADADVDALVAGAFFTEEARKDSNLSMVRDRITATPPRDRRPMLKLYQAVLVGKHIPDDDRSPFQNQLELYGLLGVERGFLVVRNQIYGRVFDAAWVRANTPLNRGPLLAVAAVLSAILVLALAAYIVQDRRPANQRAESCAQSFKASTTTTERLQNLDCIFALGEPQFDTRALELFYSLDEAEQRRFFRFEDPAVVAEPLLNVARKVAFSLPNIDPPADGYDYDQEVLEGMALSLDALSQPEARALGARLELWGAGREAAANGDWNSATTAYDQVLVADTQNVAAYYDRAFARLSQGRPEEALDDLEAIFQIAEERKEPTPSPSEAGAASPAPSGELSGAPAIRTPAVVGTQGAQTETGQEATGVAGPSTAPTPRPPEAGGSTGVVPANLTTFISRDRIIASVRGLVERNAALGDAFSANSEKGRYPLLATLIWNLPVADRGNPTSMEVSPDGKLAVVGFSDGLVDVYTLMTDKFSATFDQTLSGHSGAVVSMAFSPDGGQLATACVDGTVFLWDSATLATTQSFSVQSNVIFALAFSPDAQHIAVTPDDGTIRIFDSATGEEVGALQGSTVAVLSVAFSPDGRLMAAASADGSARIWDLTRGDPPISTVQGGTAVADSVAFSPDSTQIVTASRDGTVRLWSTGGALLKEIPAAAAVIRASFSPEGQYLLVVTRQAAELFTADGTLIGQAPSGDIDLADARFSSDGASLIMAGVNGSIHVVSIEQVIQRSISS